MMGLCECGCGQATPLSTRNRRERGIVKGQPLRFIHHHYMSPLGRPDYRIAENGCWIWQRAKGDRGYGITWRDGRWTPAHRAYYEDKYGSIPPGYHAHHVCATPPCVNPDHIQPLTPAAHRRVAPHCKLTAADASAIRVSTEPRSVVAMRYGISGVMVGLIQRGQSWRDLEVAS